MIAMRSAMHKIRNMMHCTRPVRLWYLMIPNRSAMQIMLLEGCDSPLRRVEFFHGCMNVLAHILDVPIDSIHHRTLLNDQRTEILE